MLRFRQWFAAASVAVLASCAAQPALANPSAADQEFCLMTAQITHNVVQYKQSGGALAELLSGFDETVEQLREVFELSDRQKQAVRRAVLFGYGAPTTATAQEMGQYQYVGCLSTEV